MKEIEYKGYKFGLEVIDVHEFSFYSYKATEIYDLSVIQSRTYKKYIFFGPLVTEKKYKLLLTVDNDINDTSLSKKYWAEKLDRLATEKERQKELDRGEIV